MLTTCQHPVSPSQRIEEVRRGCFTDPPSIIEQDTGGIFSTAGMPKTGLSGPAGMPNIDDYGIIDGNINRQGATFSAGVNIESVAAVPEPVGAAWLVLAGLLRRRRIRDARF